MYSFRYTACILAFVLSSMVVWGQSSTLLPINDNFRALTHSDTRVFGLDFVGTIWSSDDGGASFSERYAIVGEYDDTYYTMVAIGDTVLIAGTDALMARSGDNGDSWDASVNTDYVGGDIKAIAVRAGLSPAVNQWLAVGDDLSQGVIFSSQNDGLDWARYESGTSFSNLDFSGVVWTGSAWLACGLKSQIESGVYTGAIYRSLDGSSWTLISDSFLAPLRAMASDGGGNVLAVGEGGIMLRSTDHGLSFERIDEFSVSEDLSAVVAAGANEFIIGGDGKSVFEADADVVSVLHSSAGGAPGVEALLLVEGDVLLAGEFSSAPRTVPFGLKFEAAEDVSRLTISEALSGKVYSLETSTNLQSWDPVPNQSRAGSDGPMNWFISTEGARRFWRATEF